MNSSIFNTSKLSLVTWLYTLLVITVIVFIAGRRTITWALMKLYECFIQHK